MMPGFISETALMLYLAPRRASAVAIILPDVMPSASMWVMTAISLPFSMTERSFSQKGLRASASFMLILTTLAEQLRLRISSSAEACQHACSILRAYVSWPLKVRELLRALCSYLLL